MGRPLVACRLMLATWVKLTHFGQPHLERFLTHFLATRLLLEPFNRRLLLFESGNLPSTLIIGPKGLHCLLNKLSSHLRDSNCPTSALAMEIFMSFAFILVYLRKLMGIQFVIF